MIYGQGEPTPVKVAENRAEYGSFKDSMKAPIHRWFMYPAGFSYRLVETKLKEKGLDENSTVLDPFVGCGTTSVVAKQMGVNSVGIEAHPFVFWVAQTKLFWEYDPTQLASAIEEVNLAASFVDLDAVAQSQAMKGLPPLVVKCFNRENLLKLLAIRENIKGLQIDGHIRDFLNLALTHTLRTTSWAGTGWPYIAPTRHHEKTQERDAIREFYLQARRMYEDIISIGAKVPRNNTFHDLVLGDARESYPKLADKSVDLVLTSPPYLNNYDYADRTRLETYFFGWASTWGDITKNVRDRLMMAATTQISRTRMDGVSSLSEDLRRAAPRIFDSLTSRIGELATVRLSKGGRKSYDLMVAGYFNDIFKMLMQMYRVLKPGCDFVLVLGDSAPYGVYIPTDLWIGELALGVGFRSYQVEMLRARGEKWATNPQRHKAPLRESIVTITK